MAQVLKGNTATPRQAAVTSPPAMGMAKQGGVVGMGGGSMAKAGSPAATPPHSHPTMAPHEPQITILQKGTPVGVANNKHPSPPVGGTNPPNMQSLTLVGGVGGSSAVATQGGAAGVPSITPSALLAQQTAQQIQQQLMNNLANTKEKTPMCLINELARFNKIQHQYTLTDEQGPAHKKTFYVKLKLGDEEYAASGPSIKKAQHSGADVALETTKYKHPPPKPPKSMNSAMEPLEMVNNSDMNPSITPTVELNALAMKRGEPASYRPIEPAGYMPNFNFRGMYNQRYHYPKYPRVFYVSLRVGQREFIGEGGTRQGARHVAAAKALKVLRLLPTPNGAKAPSGVHDGRDNDSDEDENDAGAVTENGENGDGQDALKSEISLVHEIALKRNLHVNFEVTKESGPPHMRTFATRCSCGDFKTEGEGNSKKLSKKRAADRMLEVLQQLPLVTQTATRPKKPVNNKKKSRNLIKKANVDYGVGINPISRLIQIQQAKKEKEPVYSLVTERGLPRRREFVMQVTVGDAVCTGVGPNKKLAKRSAAEAMLQQLGYSRPSPQPSKPAIKSSESSLTSPGGDKKVTFVDQGEATHKRQLVPGVLLMPEGASVGPGGYMSTSTGGRPASTASHGGMMGDHNGVQHSPQTTAAIAKELLDTGSSPTAESITKSNQPPAVAQSVVRPKQQLLYLAEVLGFQVQFTDFPKGNKIEFLSLVSLSTVPPQVSHGAGSTVDDSHDMAALTALKALAEMGLDNVAPALDISSKESCSMAAGDGPHVKILEGTAHIKIEGRPHVKIEPSETLANPDD